MSGFIWKVRESKKNLYLTFDDGPVPGLTEYVIETLEEFKAKATFFCVGDNVRKNPELFRRLYRSGHAIGNHSCNHLNGWLTGAKEYVDNVEKSRREMMQAVPEIRITMFRPPYGKITPAQARRLKKEYKIVMWSLLAMDFYPDHDAEKSLGEMKKHIEKGSIIVFHDNYKAEKKLKIMLPEILSRYSALGYRFESLK
jgi:peptidoglycan/xylan/chitin deacetylase (PgdA/CDA1 family)